jgi:mannosyltransferase OCH1-like enzyme
MFDQAQLIERTLARVSSQAFVAAACLEDRVDLVQAASGSRLYSHHLAEVWAGILGEAASRLSSPQVELILREMLLLSPNHDRAEALYTALMQPRDALQRPEQAVFMIVSCDKYLAKAQALRAALSARGALSWIITGDASQQVPHWHEEGCVVAVPDVYEALAAKVAAGVSAIVQRYGPCTVVKIDDDCQPTTAFDAAVFEQVAVKNDYVGVPISDPMHDRLWHHGKTSVRTGVYSRRFQGPWARGACYLLSARAAAMVAREAVMFPGEFAGEFYEDKAMGDFMRRQGVALQALSSDAVWGISVDLQERPLKAAAKAPVVVAPVSVPLPTPVVSSVSAAAAVTEPAAMPAPSSRALIPKVLHLTWVGDDSKRPDNCIQTWIDMNPGWTVKVWGNDDLRDQEWVNARHIKDMWTKELNGVADLMRWEILYNEGGIVVDADSVCVRPLDDWLLEAEAIACWENEITRPRLIGCNMVGAVPGNAFMGQIIQDLYAKDTVIDDMAWKTVGPLCLTTAYFKHRYTGLTILPSHFFIPDHFSGVHYEGRGMVYAKQEWASTHGAYDQLHLKKFA